MQWPIGAVGVEEMEILFASLKFDIICGMFISDRKGVLIGQNSDKLGLWLVLRLGSAVAAAYRPIAPILHCLRGLVSGGGVNALN